MSPFVYASSCSGSLKSQCVMVSTAPNGEREREKEREREIFIVLLFNDTVNPYGPFCVVSQRKGE